MRVAIAIFALFSTLSVHKGVACSTERFDEFSKKCGISQESKLRIFAAADGEHWKEYPSLDKIPESNIDWSQGAFVVRGAEAIAAEIDGLGQDFSDSSLYCFDARGKLNRIEREFATARGWGYSETDSFKDGALTLHQEHYFDTKTHALVQRPAGYNDVHDAMKLKMYKSTKELPFFKLM